MRDFLRAIIRGLATYYRQILLIIVSLLGLFLLLNIGYYFISSDPDTCISCHTMRPYYNLWAHSNHRDVACVACHPDRRHLLSNWTLDYVVTSRDWRPTTEVKDESCLNCHENQTLDTEAHFERDISFDHSVHLSKPMRGVELHCTTCHNHRVPGSYLQVDHSSCFLCHFKGTQPGQSQSGCQNCHGNPTESVDHQGFQFSHQSYVDIGLQCSECHLDVLKGDAAVPQEACFTCHVSRQESFGDFPLVHEVHVNGEHIDCFRCHGQIEHGKFGLISSLEVRCEVCHVKLHTPEKQLYFGAGGQGIPDEPAKMFLAQVSCDGCHSKGEAIGEVEFGALAMKTRRESCLKCHGPGYDLMLDDWIRLAPVMLSSLEPHLRQTESALRAAEARGRDVSTARVAVEEARYNYDFVKDGRLTHNPFYAIDLLKRSGDRLKAARPALGLSEQMDLGQLLGQSDGYCQSLCHSRIPRPDEVTYERMAFPHTMHTQDLEQPCTSCHEPDNHRLGVVERQSCKECHHGDYPIACVTCHWRQDDLYRGASHELGLEERPDVMAAAEVTCDGCHDHTKPLTLEGVGDRCADCHSRDYAAMLTQWSQELTQLQERLAVKLESVRATLESAQQNGRKTVDQAKALDEIERRAKILKEAGPLHNYDAATEIYSTLQKKLEEVEDRLQPAPEKQTASRK
ncbi:MAG: hypothetical protein C4524_14235 [Candidatus Zixiibacteriota bacterium]|nr:MAG: hypothetical protein C4524_14235 [candidate division Zixibacteria bacterium]